MSAVCVRGAAASGRRRRAAGARARARRPAAAATSSKEKPTEPPTAGATASRAGAGAGVLGAADERLARAPAPARRRAPPPARGCRAPARGRRRRLRRATPPAEPGAQKRRSWYLSRMNALSTWFCEFASSIVGRFTPGPRAPPRRRRPRVAPPLHVLDPVGVPRVEVERAHLADVRAQVAVDARALEADELAEVDARPRILRQLLRAVGAMLLPGCLISAASRFRLRAASFSSAL